MATRVVNLYKEPYDVYIGRKGRGHDGYFGNPIVLKVGEPKGSTLIAYREYFYKRITEDSLFRSNILSLRDKTLGCFCKPNACHGDIIKEYLDNLV